MVANKLGQGRVAHYQARLPADGFPLMFDVESGRFIVWFKHSKRQVVMMHLLMNGSV